MNTQQPLTEDQLARLDAAQAAGEPVPADIRELVFNQLELDAIMSLMHKTPDKASGVIDAWQIT